MNQKILDQVKQAAFEDEMQKIANVRSEVIGAVLPPLYPVTIAGGLLGLLTGPKTEENIKKQNKKLFSNFIPGVAGYRLGRRLSGVKESKNES